MARAEDTRETVVTPTVITAMSRRRFAAAGIAAAAATCAGSAQAATTMAIRQTQVQVRTADGMATGLFVHPEQGEHPGLVLWPDAGGLRERMVQLAHDLAGQGFAVLMPDLHYRSATRADRGVHDNLALHAGLADGQLHRDGRSYAQWLALQDGVAPSRDGYALRAVLAGKSVMVPRGAAHRATYLVMMPRGRDALIPTQARALNSALHDMHQVARAEVYRFAAA